MDLEPVDQLQLLKELDLAQKILWDFFDLTQLNVAAIGNKTPQLHIHVIGRRSSDPLWPRTVWDSSEKTLYTPEEKEAVLFKLRTAFMNHKSI